MNSNEHEESPEADWLERALRQLPTPEIPVGLKDRLIATVPVSNHDVSKKTAATSSPRWALIAMAASIAVVCLGALWFIREQPPSNAAIQNVLIVSGDENSTVTLEIHFEGETDPCYILGPQLY